MADAISPGEAADFRIRVSTVEHRVGDVEAWQSGHDEKCAGRYRIIIGLLVLLLSLEGFKALLPYLIPLLAAFPK